MDKTIMSDTLALVLPQWGEVYTGPGILLATTSGGPVYLEGEATALMRLADRINGHFKCA